ncbi:hypothetical protein [Streptomyces geranii]|uniref:hypothetical protein n=1 Tax=Streptomyces geranii TaxID=2058923 RepID=UPI0013006C56|nr:hypothetical protein [Streptomyces geranii]
MNTGTDNLVGILLVAAVFVALALPSLLGLAHDLRVDRQLRRAQQDRRAQDAERAARVRPAMTAQDVTRAA